MTAKAISWAPVLLGAAQIFPCNAVRAAEAPELGEILVTAALRPEPASSVPTSVSVLTERTLRESGVQHFQDVLPLVPNLNWAAASSRPRYFQLRGIGDLEQYQGAPNPSVAFLVDDIDLSGVGMPATLFDVQQVEVLRGPQGTRYGANALAGLIQVRTAPATPAFEASTEATVGENDTRAIGGMIGGAIPGTSTGAVRLVAQSYESDGFRRNVFLGRDDTNGRDEISARLKASIGSADAFSADFTALYVDLDNGYDAFAIDNSRVTQSDDPGKDAQRTVGGAARLRWAGEAFDVVSITSYADSDIEHSFDGDWGNDAFWAPFDPYDFTSVTLRERRTLAQDVRVLSPTLDRSALAWLVGVYGRRLEEDNAQVDVFNGETLRDLDSTFESRSAALYGQLDWRVASQVDVSLGLRFERRSAEYDDNEGPSFDPTEDMVGGHVSAEWRLATEHTGYATLARGYKNGGFNVGAVITEERRQFRPEYLWNLETGLKSRWLGGVLETDVALFYMRRRDQQEQTSFQVDPTDPLTFVFYTDNAAKGENYGAEGTLRWRASDTVRIDATLGLLEARYLEYERPDADLGGRDQTHAPNWQYSLGLTYQHPLGFMAHADVAGRDGFYFSATDSERESAATFVNLRVGYEAERWAAYLWGANVLDEEYSQRGFFFANEPPDFVPERYTQAGDPRQLGATFIYRFE